jgi:hypothetical protein
VTHGTEWEGGEHRNSWPVAPSLVWGQQGARRWGEMASHAAPALVYRHAPEHTRRAGGGRGVGRPAGLVVVAALLLCLGRTRAQVHDWPFVGGGNTREIRVAGETIDTSSAPSVLELSTRRGAMDNVTFAQYYVQLKPNADQRELHQVRVPFLTERALARTNPVFMSCFCVSVCRPSAVH